MRAATSARTIRARFRRTTPCRFGSRAGLMPMAITVSTSSLSTSTTRRLQPRGGLRHPVSQRRCPAARAASWTMDLSCGIRRGPTGRTSSTTTRIRPGPSITWRLPRCRRETRSRRLPHKSGPRRRSREPASMAHSPRGCRWPCQGMVHGIKRSASTTLPSRVAARPSPVAGSMPTSSFRIPAYSTFTRI